MASTIWRKAIALWLSILVLAILNGALRERALIPALGEFTGLVASGAILCVCILLVALAGAPWYGRLASNKWLLIGLFWLALTLVFELSFGRLVQHRTWMELLGAYTFRGGNIWPVAMITTFISPWVAAKVRGLI